MPEIDYDILDIWNQDQKYPASLYAYKNKKLALRNYLRYMIDRLQMLFEYEGLPDSIPKRDLEMMLLIRGHAAFYAHNGQVFAASGALGGERNEYYMPTRYVFAVPYFNISKNLKIHDECVVIPNDSSYTGLMPLLRRYCSLMVENDLTMRIATVNTRLTTILTAPTEQLRASAEKYLQRVDDGELGVMGDRAIIEGIKTQPYANSGQGNQLTQLIELQQYLKASLYNEIGLNANWNAKRETLNDGELAVNNQILLPLIDDMLNQRRIALEEFNNMFGFDASVRFGSAWEDIEEIVNLQTESAEEPETAAADDVEEIDTAPDEIPEESPEEISEEQPESIVDQIVAEVVDAVEDIVEAAVEEITEEVTEDVSEAE